MPNLVTHYITGKLVQEKLSINNDDFLFGSILPDYIDNSHFRKAGKMFQIPDIKEFILNNKIPNKDIFLGYLTHLLLDTYFLEEFVPNNIYSKINQNENIFTKDKIYKEYTIISPYLLNKYNINIDEIEKCTSNYKNNIKLEKLLETITDIKECKDNISTLTYLNTKDFCSFIDETSTKIAKDIITIQKQMIRQNIKQLRDNMSKEEIDNHSSIITTKLIDTLNTTKQSYLIYNSFGSEVKTNELIEYLLNKGNKIYLPKIQGENMYPVEYNNNTELKKNNFGILEPSGPFTKINNFTCIMPLIAIDTQGNRIGYGKGYYDKFLKNKKCLKIGICYDYQIINTTPKDEYDIPLDMIITEKRIINLIPSKKNKK